MTELIEKETIAEFYEKSLGRKNEKIPQKITLKLIMDRNLKQDDTTSDSEDKIESKANKLLKLTQIHLDRENIDEIDNLVEYLGDIRNLYLQNNLIKKIENLEFFTNLKFLILSHNQIATIENLKVLINLKLLDLSNNLIGEFLIEELPKSISFLDLRENECVRKTHYWSQIEPKLKSHFIKLIQLNGVDLIKCESDEQETSKFEDSIDNLMERIIERSTNRQKLDAVNFEKKWMEKKQKLDAMKQDINEKFSNSLDLKTNGSLN